MKKIENKEVNDILYERERDCLFYPSNTFHKIQDLFKEGEGEYKMKDRRRCQKERRSQKIKKKYLWS